MPDIGLCAQVACVWEVTARKPGNVTRFHDFEDATYLDFVLSAAAIAPVMATACQRRVGQTVLEAVRATRQVVQCNTNLGIILLLAPLAAVSGSEELRAGVTRVLAALDVEDSRHVYAAIRLAAPAGLGTVSDQDVRKEPTQPLREGMSLAAGRDLVARQYCDGFAEVLDDGLPTLLAAMEQTGSVEGAIIMTHLHLMARYPDTLIARKCGISVAEEAARQARQVLDLGWPGRREAWTALFLLDSWLRAEGHARNPGTTADLVTACLFAVLRQGELTPPSAQPWKADFDPKTNTPGG
jgi:triphosphoribosyl-dephospho-CoA synthase